MNQLPNQLPVLTEKQKLIQKIERNELKLSFSAFNKFFESPSHFIQNKLEKRETTPAMEFGTLVHTVILQPDLFDEKYLVIQNINKSTKEGKAIWIEALAYAQGRKVIQANEWQSALNIKAMAYSNAPANQLLMQLTETEKKIEWKYKGYDWTGYIDGIGSDIIVDLKKVADASPSAVRRTFFKMGYHRQAWLYLYGSESLRKRKYYILAVDESGGVSVHFVDETALKTAEAELEMHLNYFKECTILDKWHMNYDFYCPNDNGLFTIKKQL